MLSLGQSLTDSSGDATRAFGTTTCKDVHKTVTDTRRCYLCMVAVSDWDIEDMYYTGHAAMFFAVLSLFIFYFR